MDKCYNGSTGSRPLCRLALSRGGCVFFDSTAAPTVECSVLFRPRSSKRSARPALEAFARECNQLVVVGWWGWLGGWLFGWLAVTSHVWLLLLVKCLFVGESLILWATQCTWTGTPPGRHTTSGSLKVLWHRWHPFLSDTRMGFFLSFSWKNTTQDDEAARVQSWQRHKTYWYNIANYN